MQPSKRFVSPDELFAKSFELARKVVASGWQPDFIVALWRGGTPIAMAMQEFFAYLGIKTDHIAIRTSSYNGFNQQPEIKVHGLHYIVERVNAGNRVLIVDDIFESGGSIRAVLEHLQEQMRANYPKSVRIATMFVKTGKNKTELRPDYVVEETTQWVVFPHEIEDLTPEEITVHRPALAQILFKQKKIE